MSPTHIHLLLIPIVLHVIIKLYFFQILYCIIDHATSAVVLALSFAGRWYAPKINVTRIPFTISILSNQKI